MIRAVKQGDFYINHRIAADDAVHHLLLNALVHRGNILPWYDTADDLIDELITCTGIRWLQTQINMAILPPTT